MMALQNRTAFTLRDFTVKTDTTFLPVLLYSVFSHHSLKQPAMQPISPEKHIIFDS